MKQNRDVEPETFAQLLADRLQAVLPPGLEVLAAEGDLVTNADFRGPTGLGSSGSYVRQFFDVLADQYSDDAQLLLAAVQHAMSDIQDWVAQMTTEPWPAIGPGEMPNPGARVEGDRLILWYGEENQPVLRLDPVPLET